MNHFRIMILFSLFALFLGCAKTPEEIRAGSEDTIIPSKNTLGIFSETAPENLSFDVDSFIGTFSGNAGTLNGFSSDTLDKKEGDFSKKAKVSVDATLGGFAGWFVSWGTSEQSENDDFVLDMSSFNGGSLRFWVKTPINLEVGIRSGNVAAGFETSKVLLSDLDASSMDNSWHQICVPLSLFEGSNPKADLSQMKVLFVISSNNASGGTGGASETFRVDDVRWDKASCSSDDHGNTTDTATVVGINSSTDGILGGDSDIDFFRLGLPSDGTLTVQTTGGTNTVGRVLDSTGNEIQSDNNSGSSENFKISQSLVSGTYFVAVSGDPSTTTGSYTLVTAFVPPDDSFGIFSETAPNQLSFDVDSFIGTFLGNGASLDEFSTDAIDKQDGSVSMKATISVDTTLGGFAGWFVSWGNIDKVADNSFVNDMSSFQGGSLRFWVRTPINLEIGIRSGNVSAGTETSKVLLSQLAPLALDNDWHQLCIPLSSFEGASPKADLSQIKVFFVISSNTPSGGTGGISKTFRVDDVRWDKTACL